MKVTPPDIIKFNELYLQLHSYAAVARATGFSASTIKKYIQTNYTPQQERTVVRFDSELPQDIDLELFNKEDWRDLCLLSAAEKTMIEKLWEELDA